MEMKTSSVFAALVAVMMLIQTLALPMGQGGQDPDGMAAVKRPKYMPTRESEFKVLMLTTLNDLIDEGVLNSKIIATPRADDVVPSQKRGGHMHLGLCFHLTPSGNPTAIPCWKGGQQ